MKHFLLLLLFCILIFPYSGFASEEISPASLQRGGISLREAILSVKEDVKSATEELNKTRSKIAAERTPRALEIQKFKLEVATLRREAEKLRTIKRADKIKFDNIRNEAEKVKREVQFIQSLLLEFRREKGRRVSASEKQGLVAHLNKIDKLLQNGETLKAVEPLLSLTNERLARNLGGAIFEGYCLDEKGVLHPGKFVLAGPVDYFIADDNSIAGLADIRPGSLNPSIILNLNRDNIRNLSEGKEAIVPIDWTLGKAIEIEGFRKTYFEHIKSGGFVMIPILALGLFCVALIIWKLLFLKKLRISTDSVLKEILQLLHNGKIDMAKRKAKSIGQPLSIILLEGIEHKDAPKEHIEEIIHERILSEIPLLEKHLPTLAVCAGAAPLLGLLGTVTGMIHTFNLVTIFGTGEARLLSGGISEALITTQYGLMIAIPTLLVHAYLSRRVRNVIDTLEQTGIGFVNGLKLKKNTHE